MTQIKWVKDAGAYVSDCKRFKIRKEGRTFVLVERRKNLMLGTLKECQQHAQETRDTLTTEDIFNKLIRTPDQVEAVNILTRVPRTGGERRKIRKMLVAKGRRDLVLASIPNAPCAFNRAIRRSKEKETLRDIYNRVVPIVMGRRSTSR